MREDKLNHLCGSSASNACRKIVNQCAWGAIGFWHWDRDGTAVGRAYERRLLDVGQLTSVRLGEVCGLRKTAVADSATNVMRVQLAAGGFRRFRRTNARRLRPSFAAGRRRSRASALSRRFRSEIRVGLRRHRRVVEAPAPSPRTSAKTLHRIVSSARCASTVAPPGREPFKIDR
jgi:hypothetical protein